MSDLLHHPAGAAGGPPAAVPVSDLQQAYLLGELGGFELGGPALFYEEYSCPPFDVDRFAACLGELVQRHDMLRARFDESGWFSIGPSGPPPLTHRSLRGRPAAEQLEALAATRARLSDRGPALGGCAVEFHVTELDGGFRVQMAGRLLAMDGFSGEIFAQELKILMAGGTLPAIGYDFASYRRSLAALAAGEEHRAARDYWTARLDSLPPAPDLPHRRADTYDARLTRRTAVLPPEVWQRLVGRIRRQRLTPTLAVAAAFAEVLRHWAAAPDFTLNVMYGERAPLHPDVGRVIGNFSGTMLLECRAGEPGDGLAGRARALQRQFAGDFRHAAYSGVAVIRDLNRRSGNVRAAVMPVVFTSMLAVGDQDEGVFLEHLGWNREQAAVRTPQVSLDHQVYLAAGGLVISWDSADDVYPPGLVDAMFGAYTALLRRLADDPEAWSLPSAVGTPTAQLAVRDRVNATEVALPAGTLHGLFLDQAARTPDRPAVIDAAGELGYAALAARAAQVAAALAGAGVGPGDLVGVHAARGREQIAALLGVLIAGAAYVPVSTGWPAARRQQVMGIAGVRAVLTDGPAGGEPADEADDGRVVLPLAGIGPETPPGPPAGPGDPAALAYVIFTSGTTGAPKGVMIRHAAAVNTVLDVNRRFGVGPDDRVLAVSDYTFDLSVYDVFGLLAAGGAVVVPDPGQAREVVHLHELGRRHGVTIWNSVPAYLGMLTEMLRIGGRPPLTALRLAMVSGDWVPLGLAADLAAVAPAARCVSLGGATEAAIWSNWFDAPRAVPPEWASVPYGLPLANQGFHVYDGQLRDRPDWVTGELYITGRGLADGYLGRPDLTREAFVTHPVTGERLYRTGDWGRYRPDGVLEFLGRRDPQVKVNGFRVELGEIEAALLEHPRVREAAVILTATPGLVGYVTADPPGDPLELRAWLLDRLPDYMVPAAIEVRRSLPLTDNGKVDRRRLAETGPPAAIPARPPVPPRSATEARLLELWRQLLPGVAIGVHDGFFALGAGSLQAAHLMNLVEAEFGVRLPLATLYTEGTVEALAAAVEATVVEATVVEATAGEATAGEPAASGPPAPAGIARLSPPGRPALVLVHPVGGDVLCYRPLVEALQDRYTVWGVAAPDDPEPAARLTTIEAIAAHYRAAVEAVAGPGPVRLAGWSLGGVVAHRLAGLLAAGGRSVRVVLVDPWAAADPDAPAPPDTVLEQAFRDTLRGGRPDDESESMVDVETRRQWRTFERHTRALLAYRPETVDPPAAGGQLRVTLVPAADPLPGPAGAYLDPLRAGRLPAGAVTTDPVPGDHFAVVAAAAAPAVADLVHRALAP